MSTIELLSVAAVVELLVPATPDKERQAEFIMLRDGLIIFEGDSDALRASQDPYIRDFLS